MKSLPFTLRTIARVICRVIIFVLIRVNTMAGQVKRIKAYAEFSTALITIKKWFTAWEFVSKNNYKIEKLQPVEFVFFDDTFVYSTSQISIPLKMASDKEENGGHRMKVLHFF